MRAVRDAGFEVGIHCYDHVRLAGLRARATRTGPRARCGAAIDHFEQVFGERAAHARRGRLADERRGLRARGSSSDSTTPPIRAAASRSCRLIAGRRPRAAISDDAAHARRADRPRWHDGGERRRAPARDARPLRPRTAHVFTLHAELEGMKLLPVLERLLSGWLAQGYELVSLARAVRDARTDALPLRESRPGTVRWPQRHAGLPARPGVGLAGFTIHNCAMVHPHRPRFTLTRAARSRVSCATA